MGEIIDKLKGKAKQIVGSITGDRGKQAEGLVDEKKGELKGKLEQLEQDLKNRK